MSPASGPYDDRRGPVAQHIALAGEPGDIPGRPVLDVPCFGVGYEGATQFGHVVPVQLGAHSVVESGHTAIQSGRQNVVALVGGLVILTGGRHDLAQTEQVGGASGLGRRPDRRPLPPAEGLTAHDRAGDAAVDVKIPGLDILQPHGEILGIEGVQSGRQAVIDGVDGVDGLLQRPHAHDAQHGGEVLGEMELAAGCDAHTDARTPQAIAQIARGQHPPLAGAQRRQAPQRLDVVGDHERSDLGVQVLGAAHPQGGGGIHQLTGNALRGPGRADQDEQGTR